MNKLIAILSFFLFSCSNTYKIKNDLKQLNKSSIKIPNNSVVTYNGKDTLIDDIFESELKLVVYMDSTSCSDCEIKNMSSWKPFLKYANIFNERLKFYYIFHSYTENFKVLRTLLMMNPIDYPVLIDKNGDFEKMNPHLPKNKAMHTFLLDENNKVILVGNPLHNKEIEKLFYKITQELLAK